MTVIDQNRTVISLSIAGDVSAETVELYLFGLPLVLAGTWTAAIPDLTRWKMKAKEGVT